MNPNHLNAYEVLKEEELQDIHSKGWLLRHKKTGARVMLIENSDENKVFNIAFRTPPKEQHRCCPHPGTQRTVRLQGISAEGSFCGAGKRISQYLPQCHDLSGQDLLPCSQLQ